MKATTNIHRAEVPSPIRRHPVRRPRDQTNTGSGECPGNAGRGGRDRDRARGKPESELRAAARRHGLNLKELAD